MQTQRVKAAQAQAFLGSILSQLAALAWNLVEKSRRSSAMPNHYQRRWCSPFTQSCSAHLRGQGKERLIGLGDGRKRALWSPNKNRVLLCKCVVSLERLLESIDPNIDREPVDIPYRGIC